MSHVVFSLLKHLETSFVHPISVNTTFDDIRQVVFKRWMKFTEENISMTYSLPGHSRCEMYCHEDYTCMLSLVDVYNLKTVEFDIMERGTAVSSIQHNSSNSNATNDMLLNVTCGETSSSVFEEDMCNEENEEPIPLLSSASWKNLIVGVNQEFPLGVEEFRNVLVRYSLNHGFDFTYKKNDKNRVTAVCKREDLGCKWKIHATSDSCGVFYVRSFMSTHTCGCGYINRKNKRLSSEIVAEEVAEKIKRNPMYRPIDIYNEFPKTHGYDISYSVAYDAVEKAKESIFGDYYQSYEETRLYLEEAIKCNPGSHIIMDVDNESRRFKRLFCSFHASIVGFNFCRPIIFLDGTFLTGRFRGQMLCATGKDGNNGLYLLAFAVVDSENIENWVWFMEHVRIILKKEREITFISDRHKGLLEAVNKVFPGFPHGFCTIHLKNNLRACMGGKPAHIKEGILKIFDKMTYATTIDRYNENLADLKLHGGEKVSNLIDGVAPEHYSHAYFPGLRYGEVTSNAAESLNSMFRLERRLPILGLIDGIRTKLMKQFSTKRDVSQTWHGILCPNIVKQINNKMVVGQSWTVIKCNEDIYEVRAKKTVMVNLLLRTCTCRGWQTNQFPCSHSLTAINRSGKDISLFIVPYYYIQSFKSSYELPIHPVATFDFPTFNRDCLQVLPPISKVQPGRRRVSRIKSVGESQRKYKCRRCGKAGHNKKGCRERVEE